MTDRGLLALAASSRLTSLHRLDVTGAGLRIRSETLNALHQRFDHVQLHC